MLSLLQVCAHLGISSCRRLNFVREFWTDVFEPFLRSYELGHTPNPDVFCNRHIKFYALANAVFNPRGGVRADFLATGHYARLQAGSSARSKVHEESDGDGGLAACDDALLRGADRLKDQSYFLSCVSGEQLSNVLFPLGNLRKAEIRALARAANLPTAGPSVSPRFHSFYLLFPCAFVFAWCKRGTGRVCCALIRRSDNCARGLACAEKRDSYGVCSVGRKSSFGAFLGNYIEQQPGQFVRHEHYARRSAPGTTANKRDVQWPSIEHAGLARYTVGGRARIPGAAVAARGVRPGEAGHGSGTLDDARDSSEALYVAHKDVAENSVTVVPGRHHPALYTDCCAIPLLLPQSSETNVAGGVSWANDLREQHDMPRRLDHDDYFHFFSGHLPSKTLQLHCKTGYNQASLTRCSVTVARDATALRALNAYHSESLRLATSNVQGDCPWLHVQFWRPVHAVTTHQVIVLYTVREKGSDFDACVGGGKIALVGRSCGEKDSMLSDACIMPADLVCTST